MIRNPASRRVLFVPVLILAACGGPGPEPASGPAAGEARVHIAGRLEDGDLDEASGIAASRRSPGTFWLIDDDGPARLYAIDATGADLGHVDVKGARNVNFEDIAAFTLDGRPYLLIADIGDNDAIRRQLTVYVVAEPDPGAKKVAIAWSFDFSYPGGPADAESLAVDATTDQVLVLTKRQIPAVLHSLPLRPAGGEQLVATRLGAIDTLPQPTRGNVASAPLKKYWWWQPTAMDITPDGRVAVILTYHGVYYYPRAGLEDWAAAFARKPVVLAVGDYDHAESVAFGPDTASIFVTFEGRHAPLLRIDLDGVTTP